MKNSTSPSTDILLLASSASQIWYFNQHNIQLLQKMGVQAHVGANFAGFGEMPKAKLREFKKQLKAQDVKVIDLPFERGRGTLASNRVVVDQLESYIAKHHIDGLHVNSSLASVLGRLVAKHQHLPVMYTAHSFYFYQHAPLKNWLYYPVERLLAHQTNLLVTTNPEDYQRAQTHFKNCQVVELTGPGVDLSRFKKPARRQRQALREQLHLNDDEPLMISVGELNHNKNHARVIKALARIKQPLHYAIVGDGNQRKYLEHLTHRLGLTNRVTFLGYREDADQWIQASDLGILPSLRESFGVAGAETLAAGKPLLTGSHRGAKMYLTDQQDGWLINVKSVSAIADGIQQALAQRANWPVMGEQGRQQVSIYDQRQVDQQMKQYYQQFLAQIKTTH